jgi:hypothetical protein
MYKIVLGILLVIGIGCTNQSHNDLPSHLKGIKNVKIYSANEGSINELQVERKQTFGTGKVIIGDLREVAVDKLGRIYIADGKLLDIKVYQSNGNFLKRLGRKGKGPGEFSEITNMQINDNGLFVYDHSRQRAIVFSLDSLDYKSVINFADNRDKFDELDEAYIGRKYLRSNDTFLTEFTKSNLSNNIKDWDRIENTGLYYLLNKDGKIISKKLIETTSSFDVLVPYGPRSVGTYVEFYNKSLTTLSENDQIYLAWSADFLIKVYNSKGDYQYAFYHPYQKVSLSRESASDAEIPKYILKGMSSMNLPETWPVLKTMFFDDKNRLWIATIIEDMEMYKWWVLRETGNVITKFKWPRDKPIQVVKNNYLYTKEKNEMGVPSIVKYSFEIN